MTPYTPGKPIAEVQRELGLDRVVKLASNENPLGPSPKAIAAVTQAAQQMHIYPDGASYDLRVALAAHFGVEAGHFVVGNGSDELIHLLGLALLDGPDDEIIVGYPSFVRYDASAFLANSKLVRVPLDSEYRHDLKAMSAACTPNTKLLYIANPNNPTGTIVHRDEVKELLDSIPSHVTVVLDEAYFEFASHVDSYPNALEFIQAGYQVVGLRTMSKAYGLAGIRVGYGIFPLELADAINRAREPFNVNLLAQVAGVAALTDTEHLEATLSNNLAQGARMVKVLEEVGAKPCLAYANFVWVDFGKPTRPIFEALLREGVIVRPGDLLGNANCMRISIGTAEETDIFEAALRKVMG
jgi:histidinol-phosphate aminotransferase